MPSNLGRFRASVGARRTCGSIWRERDWLSEEAGEREQRWRDRDAPGSTMGVLGTAFQLHGLWLHVMSTLAITYGVLGGAPDLGCVAGSVAVRAV